MPTNPNSALNTCTHMYARTHTRRQSLLKGIAGSAWERFKSLIHSETLGDLTGIDQPNQHCVNCSDDGLEVTEDCSYA